MKSIFYIISVLVDENNQPVAGSEEAIGLLTNPLAIDEAIQIQKQKEFLDNSVKINCVGSNALQ